MIFKYQKGGVTPFFVDFKSMMAPQAASSLAALEPSDDSKSKDEKDPFEDLIELLLKLDGLPNDAKILANNINRMFQTTKALGLDVDEADIVRMYTNTLSLINSAKFNKKYYEDTYNKVNNNDGLNEVAITNDGSLVALDLETGELTTISLDKINEIPENLLILTNSNLLALRAQNPDLAFSNSILEIVENGIGISKVHEYIKNSIKTLGTDIVSLNGYTKKDLEQFINGIEYLLQALKKGLEAGIDILNGMDPAGLYEMNLLTESQARAALEALNYVYTVLPDNAKNLLAIKAGGKENSLKLICDYILSGTSNKTSFTTRMVKDKNGNLINGLGGSNKTIDNDPVKSFILGKGYSEPINLNVGNSYNYIVNGRYSVLVNKQGEPLGANSTLEDVSKSAFAGVLDINNATFGGIKLNINQGRKVLLDSSDIVGMDLPIDQAAAALGIIKPDFDSLNRMEKADTIIRDQNITDIAKINQIYLDNLLPPKYDENGLLNTIEYRRFARMSGIAEESALPEDLDLDFTVSEITDENVRDNVEEVFKSKDKHYSMSSGLFGGTELYRGAIYVPVRESLIAASLGSGDYFSLPNTDATVTERAEAQNKKLNSYVKPPTMSI